MTKLLYLDMKEIKASTALIRYNTQSNGTDLCWRLILDGTEYLVNEIDVQCSCMTTRDWLDEQQVFKHHITVKNCKVLIDGAGNARVMGL